MTHFLVTGVSGLLGLNFALAVDGKKHQVTGVANTLPMVWASFKNVQAELTSPGVIENLINEIKPDTFLHCAAIANVDVCESNPDQAHKVNALLPGIIAESCRKHSIKMIQISTDAVFDGRKGNFVEEDETNPLSVYAQTKRDGELEVLKANPDALITRVNFYGWSAAGNRSLAEFFVNNLQAKIPMKGFTDVTFCPMNILDLSDLLVEAAGLDLKGIYHMVGTEPMNKYEFGLRIAQKFGLDPALITPVSVVDGNLKAARSPDLRLSTAKLRNALGRDLPSFDAGLQKFYDQYRRGYPQYIKTLI